MTEACDIVSTLWGHHCRICGAAWTGGPEASPCGGSARRSDGLSGLGFFGVILAGLAAVIFVTLFAHLTIDMLAAIGREAGTGLRFFTHLFW